MPKLTQNGYTYILHLWREKDDGRFIWRGSLTNIQNGEKKYFQSIQGLTELLAHALEDIPQDGMGAPKSNPHEDR